MYKIFPALLIILAIQSCSEKTAPDKRAMYVSMSLQVNAFNSYGQGQESYYDLKEMAEDKSAPLVQSRVGKLFPHINIIDNETAKLIALIEATKSELFEEMEQDLNPKSKNSVLLSPYHPIEPLRIARYDLSKLKDFKSTDILSKDGTFSKDIRQNIQQLRTRLCSEVVTSGSTDERKYSFHDPKINSFHSLKELQEKISKTISGSTISPDDLESVKRIYATLSFDRSFWDEVLQEDLSFNEVFNFLTALENDILLARANALEIISLRIGCCGNFNFTKILPVVVQEDSSSAQDIYLKVYLAAINEDREYIIESKNAEVVNYQDGITTLKIKAKHIPRMTISGTITMLNRSGVPKTLPWEKTIYIQKQQP